MKKLPLLLFFVIEILSSCSNSHSNSTISTNKLENLDSENLYAWLGHYSCMLDYGKMDELTHILIGYDLSIKQDSIVFSGMGYQTNFNDLCTAIEVGDTLILYYQLTLDGTDYNKNESPLLKLYKSGQKYFVKSPVVYVGTEPNIEVEMDKTE